MKIETNPETGYKAWILREDGSLAFSRQDFPNGKSTFAVEQADRRGGGRITHTFMGRDDLIALRAVIDQALEGS